MTERRDVHILAGNPAQEACVETIEGPVLVVSCPGSGKTTTLVRRIHHMLETGIRPSCILMVTFTNAAAESMRQRYEQLYGASPGVTFATIHSLCFNILRAEKGYGRENLITEEERHNFFFMQLKRVTDDAWDLAGSVMTNLTVLFNNDYDPRTFKPDGCDKKLFERMRIRYAEFKDEHRKIDFDDMLILTRDLLQGDENLRKKWQNRFRYIQCDEYQDTNFLQRDILYMLSGGSRNLCVVGDDDQSIYRFRGARPEIMLGFMKDFPDAVRIDMGINYRSGDVIVKTADFLIRKNRGRFRKEQISSRGQQGLRGEVHYRSHLSRAAEMKYLTEEIKKKHSEGIPYSDMAVLFRTNELALRPVLELSGAGIPFYTKESVKSVYDGFIFRDIRCYARLAAGVGSNEELLTVLNHPVRYLKPGEFRNAAYNEESLVEACAYLSGERWKYDAAVSRIRKWMRLLGPGTVSMTGRPEILFDRLSGADSIEYETHLDSYAEYRNLDASEFHNIFDELKKEAGAFPTIGEWLDYGLRYSRMLKAEVMRKNPEGVVLTTMHKAKGLEWPVVFVIDLNEGVIPHKKSKGDPRQLEEERRLLYVSITRAMDCAYLMSSEAGESEFLKEGLADFIKKAERESVPRYPAGTRIIHRRFGTGVVDGYKDGRITVIFDGVRKKFAWPDAFVNGNLREMK